MKGKRIFGSAVATALVLALLAGLALAQAPVGSPAGTAFTYQGRLDKDGSPVDGTCDLRFKLWDAPTGDGQVGPTLTRSGVVVSDGFFTVADLDFGAQFSGDARWLEVAVQCTGDPDYNVLSPRQELTAAPVALSLTLPFTAQGSSSSALMSVSNSGAGDGLAVGWAGDDGVYVSAAGSNGVEVGSAGDDGVSVYWAATTGVQVSAAGHDGLFVGSAGNPSATTPSLFHNGVEVAGAEGFGVYVGRADNDGVHVHEAGSPSTYSSSAQNNGIEVAGAEDAGVWVGRADVNGLLVDSAGNDGLAVCSAGDDGVQVALAGHHGVHVHSANNDGVYVYDAGDKGVEVYMATFDGVFANTMQANHEWGFYTPDAIYAGTGMAAGGPSMIVAQNGDRAPLEPGTVVAVSGAGAPFGESEFPAPSVRRVGPVGGAVAGVVYARFVAEEEVEEVEHDGQVQRRTSLHSRSAEGPAAPGDYLLLVVLGPARVRASSEAGGITAGDLLAAAGDGQVARLGDDTYRPGDVLGTAMEPLDGAQGSGLIWVLVNPR